MRAPYFLIAAALASPCFAQDTAQPLGKLFLTPEKRQTLERQRQLNLRETENLESETLQLNGVVQRSSGRNSVWINQRMQPIEKDEKSRDAKQEKATELKVGESLNTLTNDRKDIVAPGAINVRPPQP